MNKVPDDLESQLRRESKERLPDPPQGFEQRLARVVSQVDRPEPAPSHTPWALMFAAGTAAALATIALTHSGRTHEAVVQPSAGTPAPVEAWPAFSSPNPLERESMALQGEAQEAALYLKNAFVPGPERSG